MSGENGQSGAAGAAGGDGQQGAAGAGAASGAAGAAGAGASGAAGSQGAASGAQGTQSGAGGQQQGNAAAAAGAGDGSQQQQQQGAATDWRKDLAGGDEKVAKMLERYSTPADAIKAFNSLRTELSSGKYKRAEPPKDATPEQLAAWRTENGLPAEAKGYLDNLPQGLVIGDDDRPIFEALAAHLHAKHADPKYVHETVAWYNDFRQKEEARVAEADATNARETEAALKQEWGADYQANVNLRAAILATAPKEVQEALKTARLADGTLLGEYPHISRWLVSLQREINPTATVMPQGMDNPATISARIAELTKMAGNDSSDYWRGPKSEALQKEFRELLAAQERLKARAA